MFERFTERARRTIFFARYEASQYGSPYIETEHLLLGLIREDKALANRFLRQGLSIGSIRQEIEAQIIVRERIPTSVEVPLTQECKRILICAAEEADCLNHRKVTTEHLLLGILREEKSLAARVLQSRGLKLAAVREGIANAPQREQEVIRITPPPENVATAAAMESFEIRKFVLQFLAEWHTQDAKKFAGLFQDDGRFVDAHGDLWIGRPDIEKGAERLFSFSKRARIHAVFDDIKRVGADIAVVTVALEVGAGSQDPNLIKFRITVILKDTNHGWTLISAHVTEMRPPSPSS